MKRWHSFQSASMFRGILSEPFRELLLAFWGGIRMKFDSVINHRINQSKLDKTWKRKTLTPYTFTYSIVFFSRVISPISIALKRNNPNEKSNSWTTITHEKTWVPDPRMYLFNGLVLWTSSIRSMAFWGDDAQPGDAPRGLF